jgi:hypothetical protein
MLMYPILLVLLDPDLCSYHLLFMYSVSKVARLSTRKATEL